MTGHVSSTSHLYLAVCVGVPRWTLDGGRVTTMHDRLLTFLKACDRDGHLDLAGQALSLAITRLTAADEVRSQTITKSHPKGLTALQKIRGGYDLARADLRALAELEQDLENPRDGVNASSPEKEALRAVLASIGGSLPCETQARLARSMGEPDDESSSIFPKKGISPAGWYAVGATAAFTIVAGLSAFPAAITYSGNAWATALVPLAVVALLVYLLYRRA